MTKYFSDYLSNPSAGRAIALGCCVFAAVCHVLGYVFPAMASHAKTGVDSFLLAAAGFYGVAKVPETMSAMGKVNNAGANEKPKLGNGD